MNYKNALDIRDQILAEQATLHSFDGYRSATEEGEPPPPAIGVHHRPDGTYAVAIRIQESTKESESMVARYRAEYGAENVDARVTGRIVALNLRAEQRPLIIGCSSAHEFVGLGTLGCFVKRADGTLCALSNNHVYAAANFGKKDEPIFQPSFDDDAAGKIIGKLVEFIRLEPTGNKVDAAIAEIDAGIGCDRTTLTGFGKALSPPTGIFPAGTVHKIGRTTGLRSGVVSASRLIPVSVDINGHTLGFVDQLEITSIAGSFSEKGDSGSVVFDDDGALVGLLFGGNGADIAYANPIGVVFSELGVELAT